MRSELRANRQARRGRTVRLALMAALLACALAPAGGLAIGPMRPAAETAQAKAALIELAERIQTITLDAEGKSRGDYSVLDAQWREYEPAWHTGQAVYALVRAYEVTRDSRFLASARRAGDWWLTLEITDPPALAGMVRAVHGAGIDAIVFATVSDGTPGLFRLAAATGDPRYARVPTRAGEWMIAHMWDPASRMFYDAVDPRTGDVMRTASPFWPDKARQALTDVARPNNEGALLKDMFAFTGDPKYRDLFLAVCDSVVEKQGPEGLWMDFTPNDNRTGAYHPRFNLWYAESLVDGYELTRDARYLEAAVRTARFYARIQDDDGAFHYGGTLDGKADMTSVSGSTTALAGMLWMRLADHGAGAEFQSHVNRSLRWLLANRYPRSHPDPNLAGGVHEVRSTRRSGVLRVEQRDIADAFAVRFLADYLDRTAGAVR